MNTVDRRTVTRTAVWGLPAVMVATAAPAFAAASGVPQSCEPVALCKAPGAGQNTKDYMIDPRCGAGATVIGVRVRDDKREVWVTATLEDGAWVARGFNDSRRNRLVEVATATGVTVHSVAFPPC